MPPRTTPRALLPAALLLAAVTFLLYWPVRNFEFVDFDDRAYLFKPEVMQLGLTPAGVAASFTGIHVANWHPVTTIVYLLEVRLFGLDSAGPFHLVNAALHAINAGLMCLVLWALTRSTWPSISVSALFALHPLHVESVAWVAELKDVLSVFFMLLTLWAYAAYVRRRTWRAMFLVAVFYALGLMSKPMLVTLPTLLLLLDYWPLKREAQLRPLLLEKIPLFVLAAGAALATLLAQHTGGAVASLSASLGQRLANVPLAYVMYLAKTFWPAKLSVFYPTSAPHSWWPAAAAALIGITAAALLLARRAPYCAVGWLWYLITLVPVIGLIQVGQQAMADRYTYIPLTGIFIMIAWGMGDLLAGRRFGPPALIAGAAIVLLALTLRTSSQIACWRNDETLFRNALASTKDNPLAEFQVGEVERKAGRLDRAIEHFQNAVRITPNATPALTQLGLSLMDQASHDEAVKVLQKAAALADAQAAAAPQSAALQSTASGAHQNLGVLWNRKNDLARAVDEYQAAIRIDPKNHSAHHLLGVALVERGEIEPAKNAFRAAQQLKPGDAALSFEAGATLDSRGHAEAAVEFYRRAIALNPGSMARNNLAWIMSTSPNEKVRNGAEAVRLASEIVGAVNRDRASLLDTLAAAYAEAGRFDDAVRAAEEAVRLAAQDGQSDVARDISGRLELYRRRKPFRAPAR